MATTTNPWNAASVTTTPNITPGLINSVPGTSPDVAPTAYSNPDGTESYGMSAAPKQESFGYTPSTRAVDAASDTVSGQYARLTDAGNPFIQAARTGAAQQMNGRGLINSSMAQGASDAAAYAAALPIAQSDATVYNNVADKNTAYQNDALKYDTAAQNEAGKANLAAWVDSAKANMDSATKVQLAAIESDYKIAAQTSNTTAEMYKQMVQNISNIATNTTLSAAAKQTATDNQISLFKSGMTISGAISDLDLGSLLDFTSKPAV